MINTINPPKKKAANIQVDKLRTFEEHPKIGGAYNTYSARFGEF